MSGYGDSDRRRSSVSSPLPQSSRLLAPTRSSLAKTRPSDGSPSSQSSPVARGRRMSDVTELSHGPGRETQKESKGRRSSFPVEDSKGAGAPSGQRAATGGSGKQGRASADSTSMHNVRTGSDQYSPEKAKFSPEKPRPSPEKAKQSADKGRKPSPASKSTPSSPMESPGRIRGRASGTALAESGKLSGGEKTPTAVKREVQSKPSMAMPTSPRSHARPDAHLDSYKGRQEPRSPLAEKRPSDALRALSTGGARKDKAVQRTLLPSQRGGSQADYQGIWSAGADVSGSFSEGQLYAGEGVGYGEQWAEDAMRTGAEGRVGDMDAQLASAYRDSDGAQASAEVWQKGSFLGYASGTLAQQQGDSSARSASERSSAEEDELRKGGVAGAGAGQGGAGTGAKGDEGSPVSVLDVGAAQMQVQVLQGQEALPKGSLSGAGLQVAAWHPDSVLAQSSVVPIEQNQEGLSAAAAAAVAAAISSPLPSYMLDIANLDFMGDISGMEQDLEYVRHVLLLSGFAGKVLPPVHSETNPIHPGVFEQLEQGITTGAVEGAHDAIVIDKARQAEERRQRRLLFDAVNEALGRRLMPYYARPIWVKPSQPVIKKLPLGKNLLKEVWEEIHDWPIASSEEVYDILDDAARRDMSRGTERWVEMGQERAECVFEIEQLILEGLLEEVAREFCNTEKTKQERRLQARLIARQRRPISPSR